MAMLEVERIPVGDNYVWLLHEPGTRTTGVVDPATASPVLGRLRSHGWSLDWILITHHHADHTGGNLELKRTTDCRIAGPKKDATRVPGLDLGLAEGDTFSLGDAKAQIFETPGHTSGHISFWFEEARALFCADTLFSLGCGRLFEGTPAQMWDSLRRLAKLPDDTVVYCGHEYTLSNARFALTVDPDNPALRARAEEVEQLRAGGQPTVPSTLGAERQANPFLRPDDPAIRQTLGMERASDVDVFAEIRKRKDRF